MDIDGERKDLINKEIETFRRRNEVRALQCTGISSAMYLLINVPDMTEQIM